MHTSTSTSTSNPRGTTWTNGRVSLTKDLVFGVCVLSEDGWVALANLSPTDMRIVRDAVDHNPSCPFKDEVYGPQPVPKTIRPD